MNTRMKLTGTSALALCLSLATLPVFAQSDNEVIQLDQIIIAYRADGTPVYAGDDTTRVDSEEVESAGASGKVDDVLRAQPSTFTRYNAQQTGVAVNIRGFEGNGRVAMAIDGVPQNFRFTGHEAMGFAYIDPLLLSSIDITRGANTTAGGTGLAGSVNFRTIDPVDLVEEGEGFGSQVKLSYGDNGNNRAGMLATAYSGTDFDVMFAATNRQSDNFEDGAGNEVSDTGQDTTSYLGKVIYRIDDNQSLKFSAMHYESEFGANSYYQEMTNDTVSLGYNLIGASPLVNLSVNAYYAENSMLYTESISGTGSYAGRNLITKTLGANVTNTSEFAFGNWLATSVNGLEYSRDDLGGTTGNVNPVDGETTRFSLFSQNTFDNGPWEVTAAFRANSYTTKGVNVNEVATDIDKKSFDPKLTIGYQLTDWLQPYVSVSRTTRIPTLSETLLGGNHGDSNPSFFVPNPDLKPEVSTGFDIGFNIDKADLFVSGDRLTGRVNYYEMDVEDYIVSGAVSSGGFGYGFYNVDGTSKTKGVEVGLDYMNDLYEIGFAYTHTDSDLPPTTDGLGASQYLPDDTASLRTAVHLLDNKLTVGGIGTYVSTGPDAGSSNEDYALMDLFASYELSEAVTLDTKLTNAFDKDYTPWLTTNGKGRGRTIYVGMNLNF
jgi:TonB-dependent heme/hemoglobin receptor family protein